MWILICVCLKKKAWRNFIIVHNAFLVQFEEALRLSLLLNLQERTRSEIENKFDQNTV